jgi:hypothetical protein
MPTVRRRNPDVAVKALEGIVSANTFFTVAVFIGITGTITPSSGISPNCLPGDDIARNFFLFEILSFGFYLLSSLVAQGMKLAVTLLAAACSIMGTFFLLLSMVDAIQLKFGLVSCGIPLAVGATLALAALVLGGLVFYGFTVAYALTHYLP